MAESSIGFNGENVSYLFSFTSALFSFDQTLFSFLPFSLRAFLVSLPCGVHLSDLGDG
jgi:hypothetical protein